MANSIELRKSYIDSQIDKLKCSQFYFTIQIKDALGNKTNHININDDDLVAIQAILNKSNKE